MIVEYRKEINIDNIITESPKFDVRRLVNRSIDELFAATASDDADEQLQNRFEEKLILLAGSKMAYAQFGYLPYNLIDYFNGKCNICKISSGDIIVFYPEKFESKYKKYNCDLIINEDEFLKELDNELQEYPKYKIMDFGNVKFFNEARIEELQRIIEISNSKEEIIVAYEDKIKSILCENDMTIRELMSSIENKDAKIERLKDHIKELESKNENLKMQMDILINSMEEKIEEKKQNNKTIESIIGQTEED